MIEFAQKKEWSTSMAAQQFGFSKESMQAACEKFKIYLDGDQPRGKKLSCSPKAISDALARKERLMKAKGDTP
jgi:hypothetical protein